MAQAITIDSRFHQKRHCIQKSPEVLNMLIYMLIAKLFDQSLHIMQLINQVRAIKHSRIKKNWKATMISGRDESRFSYELQRMPDFLISRHFVPVDCAKIDDI